MRGTVPDNELINLEAPGDFLSELLGVREARVLTMEVGVREVRPQAGDWRVLSALEGSVRAAWGETGLPLAPGQALAVPGGEELSILAPGPCRLALVTLCGSAAERVFLSERENGGLFFERGGEALTRMLRLLAANRDRTPAKEASSLAYSLLMSLHGTGSPGPAGRQALPQVVEAALGLLRRDYAFLEGVGELAERLEVSQEYLTRCFCKYAGVTPGKYLNQLRVENARLLLRQGHSVQFVSDACGFSNANYFARVFRRYVGLNPREDARSQPPAPAPDAGGDTLYVL